MPIPELEKLTKDSGADEVSAAVSSCVGIMSKEHSDWDKDRVVAACHSMARKKQGKSEPGVRTKESSRLGGP